MRESGTADPLAHDRFWRNGTVQAVALPGVTDLGPGYLGPGLLPVSLLRDAYDSALSEYGSAGLAYGDNRGALSLRNELAGASCDPDQLVITAGSSHTLYLLATMFARPGAVILVDTVCYDLGRRIFTDCGLRLREVPGDSAGMDPEALAEALRIPDTAAFVYLNPTFHNPTGRIIPLQRRLELLAVAREHDTLIVEDDAYVELMLGCQDPPSSLAELSGYQGVIRLLTFSKSLAPGLRLGWLQAEHAVTDRLVSHGLFASGGALNHTTSLAVLAMLRSGAYSSHLAWLREQLRARRDAIVAGLQDSLGEHFRFVPPSGGFFVWLTCRAGVGEDSLLSAARRAGVRVSAGSPFGTPGQTSIRLSYSLNGPAELDRAARRLASAFNAVASKA